MTQFQKPLTATQQELCELKLSVKTTTTKPTSTLRQKPSFHFEIVLTHSETFESLRAERGEVVLGQVQVDQPLHPGEGAVLHLRDLAALQVERHHLWDAGEAVARDVVEVVATQVEEFGVGREALRNLGVAAVLAGGVVRLGLQENQRERVEAPRLPSCYYLTVALNSRPTSRKLQGLATSNENGPARGAAPSMHLKISEEYKG